MMRSNVLINQTAINKILEKHAIGIMTFRRTNSANKAKEEQKNNRRKEL